METLVSIGEAAKALGVSITTWRRWEAEGRLIPEHATGGHRCYDLAKLKPELFRAAPDAPATMAYARVSSHDQKDDLERQKQMLEGYCARQATRTTHRRPGSSLRESRLGQALRRRGMGNWRAQARRPGMREDSSRRAEL